jgi:hypothetical protein
LIAVARKTTQSEKTSQEIVQKGAQEIISAEIKEGGTSCPCISHQKDKAKTQAGSVIRPTARPLDPRCTS